MKRIAQLTLYASLALSCLGAYSYLYGGALLGMLELECPAYGSVFLTPRCARPLTYLTWGARLASTGALVSVVSAVWLLGLHARARRE
jgi:hypothetical protein